MSEPGAIAIAVLAALGAACAFGVGVALQHRQARQETVRAPVRLLAQLARRRMWLAGIGLAVAAYGLQALALAYGPLTLVAPVVATDLLFALPVAAAWERRSMGRREWTGSALVAGSITLFLAVAPPPVGRSSAPAGDWVLAFAAVTLISATGVIAGLRSRAAARAVLLAIAAGVVFGLTAAVTLSMTRILRAQGAAAVLGHWEPWVLLALGAAGLLLSATAYQAGALRASLPIMDTVEPVSGVAIGTVVFGERLAASPAGLALQLCAGAAAVTGIVMLGRSPLATGAPSSAGLPVRPDEERLEPAEQRRDALYPEVAGTATEARAD
jgi:drug/metabolite transporter (DMT)-like permease